MLVKFVFLIIKSLVNSTPMSTLEKLFPNKKRNLQTRDIYKLLSRYVFETI